MKIVKWLLIALGALLLLAGALAWTAPAELAYRLFGSRLSPLVLEGITGTVWEGKAERAGAFGESIGTLGWRFARLPLLSGRLEGDLVLTGDRGNGTALVRADRTRVEITALRGEFPASLLSPALDIPALNLLGRVSLDVARVVVADGYLQAVDGEALWREMAVAGAANASLPGVAVRFAPATDGAVVGTIRDLGGPLAVAGEVQVRGAGFQLEARLVPREPNPQLEEMLKFVGERLPEGGSLLRVRGELQRMW